MFRPRFARSTVTSTTPSRLSRRGLICKAKPYRKMTMRRVRSKKRGRSSATKAMPISKRSYKRWTLDDLAVAHESAWTSCGPCRASSPSGRRAARAASSAGRRSGA